MFRNIIICLLLHLSLSACGQAGQDTAKTPAIRKEYQAVRDSLNKRRLFLAAQYKAAKSEKRKAAILDSAGRLLTLGIGRELIAWWYGTPYDFYGSCTEPKQGNIACGYFVTILLQHMGADLDRVALAETYSESMIKTLASEAVIRRYRNQPHETFLAALKKQGDGLYLTGLDNHTGFLLVENGQVWFLHAYPPGVKRESAELSSILVASRYKVTARISADPVFLRRWLSGQSFR